MPTGFTAGGWPDMVRSLGSWEAKLGLDACLGTETNGHSSPQNPYDDYSKAYIKQWQDFLNDTHLKQDFNAQTAAERFRILYSEHSPLLAVFSFVSRNTQLPASVNSSAHDSLTSAAQQISAAFQPVQKIVPPGSDRWSAGWWTDEYRKHLVEVESAMVDVASHPSDHAAKRVARDKSSEAVRVIEAEKFPAGADGVTESVKALLKAPFQRVLQLTDEDPSAKANGMLNGFCRQLSALAAKTDITEKEFDGVFDPREGSFFQFQRSGLVRRDGAAGLLCGWSGCGGCCA